MKLKYECPAPSKFGSDQPLWKTATMGFLRIVTASVAVISRLEEGRLMIGDLIFVGLT